MFILNNLLTTLGCPKVKLLNKTAPSKQNPKQKLIHTYQNNNGTEHKTRPIIFTGRNRTLPV